MLSSRGTVRCLDAASIGAAGIEEIVEGQGGYALSTAVAAIVLVVAYKLFPRLRSLSASLSRLHPSFARNEVVPDSQRREEPSISLTNEELNVGLDGISLTQQKCSIHHSQQGSGTSTQLQEKVSYVRNEDD